MKRPRNIPSDTSLKGSLEHIRYEFGAILLPITDYTENLREVVEFWHLSHTRLLLDFFTCKWISPINDLIYTDYFAGRQPIVGLYGNQPDQEVKNFISQKLLHLTMLRFGKNSPPSEKLWPTAQYMQPIKEQSLLFIEDVIQMKLKFAIDNAELAEWKELKRRVTNQIPFSSNSGNVAISAMRSYISH